MAVSLTYDWIWWALTEEEREIVCNALIENVIKQSDYNHFRGFKGNWSSICNCGIVMACIAICEHNPELAESYSTRIVRLLDGHIVSDSNPFLEDEIIDELQILLLL